MALKPIEWVVVNRKVVNKLLRTGKPKGVTVTLEYKLRQEVAAWRSRQLHKASIMEHELFGGHND